MNIQEVTLILSVIGLAVSIFVAVRTTVRDTQKDDDLIKAKIADHDAHFAIVDTKLGLFWRLIEDNMAHLLEKANPIHLEPDEKVAAAIYSQYKRNSDTIVLLKLSTAVKRELGKKYMPPDEVLIFTLLLGAIRSQLIDRGILINDDGDTETT